MPGDLVRVGVNEIRECRPAPHGDFCSLLDPKSYGGRIVWADPTVIDRH